MTEWPATNTPGTFMATTTPPAPSKPSGPQRKPEWAPRMWEGCDFFAWMRLLSRNRFAVHPRYWYIAAIITCVSFCHTMLRLLQDAIYGRRVAKTIIEQHPIFILGHWRTGTTLLHEFMILDPRHSFPTTYECLNPNHFLLTEKLFSRLFKFLMPSRRPMDNMKFGFDRPQEDEFALCMLGQPSPYLTIAFPNRPPQCQKYLDLEGISPRRLRSWKRDFLLFLKQVTFRNPRRLILKSPPHTARIKVLRQMFPQALFVHIVRDPYVVYPSTVNLWKTLFVTHGLQKPTFRGVEDMVFENFTRMYDRLDEGKKLLDPQQYYELRYEDLTRDPVNELRKMYDHFQLGGFNQFLPPLQDYLATIKGYETNRYQLSEQERAEVTKRWGKVIRQYGYDKG